MLFYLLLLPLTFRNFPCSMDIFFLRFPFSVTTCWRYAIFCLWLLCPASPATVPRSCSFAASDVYIGRGDGRGDGRGEAKTEQEGKAKPEPGLQLVVSGGAAQQ